MDVHFPYATFAAVPGRPLHLGPRPGAREVISLSLEKALRQSEQAKGAVDDVVKRSRARAKAILESLTPKQRALVLDPAPHVSGICPRRAGKSYAGAAAALIAGEAKPGSITAIISLNLKQLRRLYWAGGPSGLFTLNTRHKLNLSFNNAALRWEHENGSIGYLLGAEDREQLEVIRGMEADLYIIDECKSFAPMTLRTMIDEIIDPQRGSRKGRLVLIGTPGNIPEGPFFEATCPRATEEVEFEGRKVQMPFLVPYGQKDPWGRTATGDLLWSCHSWTLQDNTAQPHLWEEATKKKRQKRWADDDPTWLREYLGQWTTDTGALVFRYGLEKPTGRVTWAPQPTLLDPLGLPPEGAPWRFCAGLDFGFEAPTALVVLGYSQRLRTVRHVLDRSERHLLYHEVVALVRQAIEIVGNIEGIFADAGNLGKTLVASLIAEGFPLEAVPKREKHDHIEIANSMFAQGEIQIIEGTTLESQLITNVWDFEASNAKYGREMKVEELARLGKLVEDKHVPNDSTDAFIYALRGCLHRFGAGDPTPEAEVGSRDWERESLRKYRERLARPDARFAGNQISRAPAFLRRALGPTWTNLKNSISTHFGR